MTALVLFELDCPSDYTFVDSDDHQWPSFAVIMPDNMSSYSLIAMEVGFTETREKLLEDAEWLLRGLGMTELAVSVKFNERWAQEK